MHAIIFTTVILLYLAAQPTAVSVSKRLLQESHRPRRSVGVKCTEDSDCCAGAKCLFNRHAEPTSLEKHCVKEDESLCDPCPYGFGYLGGLCEPSAFPCRSNPCKADKGNPVCVYEPKNCGDAKTCKQYRCTTLKQACADVQDFDERTSTCVSRIPETIDGRRCRACVHCVQQLPTCDPPCQQNFECRLLPQTCHRCPTAKCVRLPLPGKEIHPDLPDYLPETDPAWAATPEYLTTQQVPPSWVQSPCVHCAAIDSECPRCPFGTKCIQMKGSCNKCPVTQCASRQPILPC